MHGSMAFCTSGPTSFGNPLTILLSKHNISHDYTIMPTTTSTTSTSSYMHQTMPPFLVITPTQTLEMKRMNKKMNKRHSSLSLSFSASLPGDVQGVFSESICAVKYSSDPFADFRQSILEMIEEVGVKNWEEMEELVYCYVALNSPDVHAVIAHAFLSVYETLN